jgi:sugar/nucleoside kinase (ribokinase family)
VGPERPADRWHTHRPVGVFVGLSTLDVVHRVQRVPGANEKVTAGRQDLSAGGPAANAAVVFAALGGEAVLVTALGSDPLADLISGELAVRGVRTIDVTPDDPEPPAVSAVAVTEHSGERSVVSPDAGARSLPTTGELEQLVDGLLASGADVVLIDGHHPALALAAGRAAGRRGVPVLVDAGRWKPVMAELLPLADEVVCSADFRWPGTASPDESSAVLRQLPSARTGHGTALPDDPPTPRMVAVTHGGSPIQWWQGEGFGSVPVPAVAAVDTLGAGDAMHGAYAFLRTDPDLSVTERLAGAATVAALRCSIIGPREWLAELESLTLTGQRDLAHQPPTGQDQS